MPPTVFLGERTANTTEWTVRDTPYAVALELYEAQLCSGCGGDLAETTKPEHEDAYETDDPTRCHMCTARSRKAEKYADTPQADALMFETHLRTSIP